MAAAVARGEGKEEDISTLGPTTEIEQLADEIDLLAPESVAASATRLFVAVVSLGVNAHGHSGNWAKHVPINEAVADYTAQRNRTSPYGRIADGHRTPQVAVDIRDSSFRSRQ